MPATDHGVNDVDSIVLDWADADEVSHVVEQHSDVLFSWDYERSRVALGKLYEKAKTSQWNATTDLPWHLEVDPYRDAAMARPPRFEDLGRKPGSPFANWSAKEWDQLHVEMQAVQLSQFLHGEQGALICAGLITGTVPWYDAKLYAATQVVDEARHVEVFGRYLHEKLESKYAISPWLGRLLDDTIADPRWDMTYLGMQIMIEGLALAAFGFQHALTSEPLLKQLLRYVMSDEARHVAFGVLSLQEFYGGLDGAEIRERQEFAYEAAVALRNRHYSPEVWERLGQDPKAAIGFIIDNPSPQESQFQSMLFAKIVPNLKKLGLLDAGDGWLRTKFGELGVLQYEHDDDATADVLTFDAVTADRAAGG